MCANEAAAERAVNEVWESCFNDTRPFDEVSSVLLLVPPPLLRGGGILPAFVPSHVSHADLLAGGKERHTYDHVLFLNVGMGGWFFGWQRPEWKLGNCTPPFGLACVVIEMLISRDK